jgi:hypothetical protein
VRNEFSRRPRSSASSWQRFLREQPCDPRGTPTCVHYDLERDTERWAVTLGDRSTWIDVSVPHKADFAKLHSGGLVGFVGEQLLDPWRLGDDRKTGRKALGLRGHLGED